MAAISAFVAAGERPAAASEEDQLQYPYAAEPPIQLAQAIDENPLDGDSKAMTPEEKERARLERLKDIFELHGFRTLKYRSYSSSGASDRFLSQNGLLTRGARIEQTTNLVITADVEEKAKLTGHWREYPQQERDIIFDVEAGHAAARFGDFNAEFKESEITPFTKKITGTKMNYDTNRLKMGFFASESKSDSKTETFSGQNHHGPYDLRSTQIVEGSETVYINGQPIPKDKYRIEYFTGSITFCAAKRDSLDCRVIKPSDEVRVTYDQKLILSLNSGNLTGVSASYQKSKNSPLSFGGAFLSQKSNSQAEEIYIKKSKSFQVGDLRDDSEAAGSVKFLDLNDEFLVKSLPPSITIFSSAENRSIALSLSDYFFNDEFFDYASGVVRFATDPSVNFSATDRIQANYFTYNLDFIAPVTELKLTSQNLSREDANTFLFDDSLPIYVGGTGFRVQFCENPGAELDSLPNDADCEDLVPADYTIDEDQNKIAINGRPVSEDSVVVLDYYSFPASAGEFSAFDHTVGNFFAAWKPNRKLNFRAEMAQSKSDLSANPIQVTGEVVAQIASDLDCTEVAGQAPFGCAFVLQYKPVVDGSELIFINDALREDAILRAGTDYRLDLETGILTLKRPISISNYGGSAVLFADYQFRPPQTSGDLTTGTALRLTTSGDFKKYGFNVAVDQKDFEFAPIGSENTQETYRLSGSAKARITESLAATLGYTTSNRQFDALGVREETAVTKKMDMKYSGKRIKTAAVSLSSSSQQDNLAVKKKDNQRDSAQFSVGFKAPLVSGLTVDWSVGSESYNDNTGKSADIDTDKSNLGFNYMPSPRVTVGAQFNQTAVSASGGLVEAYTTENKSRLLNLTWSPHKLVQFDANINRQRSTDSRPAGLTRGIDSSNIRVSAMPFGRFRSIHFISSAQDYPSVNSKGTKNRIHSLNLVYTLSPSFSLTPNFTISNTQSLTSSTESDSRSWKLRYQPPNNPKLTGNFEIQTTDRSTIQAGNQSSSDSSRTGFDLRYAPGPRFIHTLNWINTSNSAGARSNDSRTLTWKTVWNAGPKLNLDATWQNITRSGSLSGDENTYTLTSDYKMSKILAWENLVKIQDYADKSAADLSYNGTLIETQIKAEFP